MGIRLPRWDDRGLIDVRQRACARGSFDRLERDVLNLLFGIVELTLKCRELLGLARDNLFQRRDSQFGHAPIRLRIFGRDEKSLLVLLRSLPACLAKRALDFPGGQW